MTENQFIVAGYLGSKPELRQLPSGTDVANVRLAQSYMLLGKNEERTNWFNLTFYGKLAHVAMQFDKGDNIHITAFLEHREWETKAGGKRNTGRSEEVPQDCQRESAISCRRGRQSRAGLKHRARQRRRPCSHSNR